MKVWGHEFFKYPALMGIFSLPLPNTAQVNMISISPDPWIIHSPDQVDFFGDIMLLSPIEIDYCEVILASAPLSDHTPSSMYLHTYS